MQRKMINDMTGHCDGQTIFIKSGDNLIPVFPVYREGTPYYPLVPAYCFTVHKVMGQTIPHVTLVFDSRYLPPAVGYVALPRVSDIDNVVPMLWLRKSHFLNY